MTMTMTRGTDTNATDADAGGIVPDWYPAVLRELRVERLHVFDVPTTLREHAHNVLPIQREDESVTWWTIGRMPVDGVSRWVVAHRMPGGAVAYGLETEKV